jgi:hypothetical protein
MESTGGKMQQLLGDIITEVKKEKMKKMEFELSKESAGLVQCPFCMYESKNKRFSGKIFQSEEGKTFKCFACGIWRKL